MSLCSVGKETKTGKDNGIEDKKEPRREARNKRVKVLERPSKQREQSICSERSMDLHMF